MLKKFKKLSYYNYFLLLSIVLIVGYFATSIYFLNRSSESGMQAVRYGATVEKLNAIIQNTIHLENIGYHYKIGRSDDKMEQYQSQKEKLIKSVNDLSGHCSAIHFAVEHTALLNALIFERIDRLDSLVMNDDLDSDRSIRIMNDGEAVTQQILNTLNEIRTTNSGQRMLNQKNAAEANENAMNMLSVFGSIVLFFVVVSFFKMRREIKRNEHFLKEIHQINFELNAVNENLENFAYIASHDLNEPLRKIRTFGDLVKTELKNDQIDETLIVSHVARMQNASERMQQLIKDLLIYSRIASEVNDHQEIDLKETIDKVVNDLEITIKDTDATIQITSVPSSICADNTQMRQLFQNLISNALKFRSLEVAPLIKIDSHLIKATQLPVEEWKKGVNESYWKISVVDNGIGFNQQYVDRIFAVFQRLHGRSQYVGTGIGLSICKKICENHKGFITAHSEESKGATFTIYLPAKIKE